MTGTLFRFTDSRAGQK
jgi:hypothetical protein